MSAMSPPAQNDSPAPARTSTRTSWRSSTPQRSVASSSPMRSLIGLRRAGSFRVSSATPSVISSRIVSAIARSVRAAPTRTAGHPADGGPAPIALEEQLLGGARHLGERLRVDRVEGRPAGDPHVREAGLLLADGEGGDGLPVLALERDRRRARIEAVASRVPALLRHEVLPLEVAKRPEQLAHAAAAGLPLLGRGQ